MSENEREEKDSMGVVNVPRMAYYGASTQRAVDNFIKSGLKLQDSFINALAMIKKYAARANSDLGLIGDDLCHAIMTASTETMEGHLKEQFVVDVFQTGSGTSTNMNMNEVIASRANEILTGKKGGKSPIHPNDHVNLGQSSNDVIPSALHVAAIHAVENRLIPIMEKLEFELRKKAKEFKNIQKIGRTHLQDAVPIELGQEFSGFARQIKIGIRRIRNAEDGLSELALGGTAVGNGLNTHPDFAPKVIKNISKELKFEFKEAKDHFEAQAAQDAAVEASGALKTIAAGLMKIANDIRFLGSGPRVGIGEIMLPSLQPGSSIMPGKVNPIIPESMIQIAAQVIGNDTTITLGGVWGNLELNTMLPVMTYNLLQSIELLSLGMEKFTEKCVSGIKADKEKCASGIEKSLALVTYLVPELGYDRAAEIAGEAYRTGKNIREIIIEKGMLTKDQIKKIFPV